MKDRWISLDELMNWAEKERLDPRAPESFHKLANQARILHHLSESGAARIARTALEILMALKILKTEDLAPRRYIG